MISQSTRVGMPDGWATCELQQIADVQLGKMLDKKRTAGVRLRYVRNINIRWDRIDLADLLEMPFLEHELDRFGLAPGDVLVCEGGEPGRAAVWTIDEPSIKYQKALHRVRMHDGVLPRWLVLHLFFDAHRGVLERHFTGTTIRHFPREAIQQYVLRIAPAAEQHRVVDAVDSYFTRLDVAVATLERVQRNLQRYRASVLKAAVEGRLVPTEAELARVEGRTYEPAAVVLERILAERRRRWEEAELAKLAANGDAPKDDRWKAKYVQPLVPDVSVLPDLPEGWCWTRIGTAGRVQLGRQRSPAHHTGTHMRPYLRVANVFEDRIDVSDVMTMNFTEKEFETYRLEFGDILLNEGQSPHLVGRPAMYRDELPGACFTNSLVRFQATEGVDRRFALIVFLAQLHTRRYMRIAQITTNIAHLGAGRFAEIEFPLPPQSEQARIADEVERVMSTVEATMATVAFNLARLNRCRQSILGWAFEGRLVDQGPSDEPASALLTRIRAERHARTAEAGRRRRRGSTALRARRRKEQENA